MKNFVIVLILILIISAICFYLYKAKKRGETCIGCPYAKQCGGNCNGGCNNGYTDTENQE